MLRIRNEIFEFQLKSQITIEILRITKGNPEFKMKCFE